MPGVYNTTQKNLLVGGDQATQCVRRLELARNADERRDVPQLRTELRELIARARALADDIHDLRTRYDDGDFEPPAG